MPTPDPELPRFHYDAHHDINDGEPWSKMDIADLRACIEHGETVEATAAFLCRGR